MGQMTPPVGVAQDMKVLKSLSYTRYECLCTLLHQLCLQGKFQVRNGQSSSFTRIVNKTMCKNTKVLCVEV